MRRNRPVQLLLVICVIVLGLASRHYRAALPDFLGAYAGDTLWALCVFYFIGLLWTRGTVLQVAGVALAFSYCIEISQLYHAPWIDAIRHTTLGGLILGFGFLWSDMACYTVGVTIGVIGEIVLRRRPSGKSQRD